LLELAPGISGAAGAVASAFAFATWKARARSIGGGNDQGHPTLEKTMRKAQKSQKTSKNKTGDFIAYGCYIFSFGCYDVVFALTSAFFFSKSQAFTAESHTKSLWKPAL